MTPKYKEEGFKTDTCQKRQEIRGLYNCYHSRRKIQQPEKANKKTPKRNVFLSYSKAKETSKVNKYLQCIRLVVYQVRTTKYYCKGMGVERDIVLKNYEDLMVIKWVIHHQEDLAT